jgi:hypothetical protein
LGVSSALINVFGYGSKNKKKAVADKEMSTQITKSDSVLSYLFITSIFKKEEDIWEP